MSTQAHSLVIVLRHGIVHVVGGGRAGGAGEPLYCAGAEGFLKKKKVNTKKKFWVLVTLKRLRNLVSSKGKEREERRKNRREKERQGEEEWGREGIPGKLRQEDIAAN